MRRKPVLFFAMLLLGGWMFGTSPLPAHACSCVGRPSPEIALQRSAAVFAGEVLSIKEKRPNPFGDGYLDFPIEVTFRVTEVWKGVGTDRLTVRTSMSSCGFGFAEGMPYLVYANETQNGLVTGLCTRTADLALAADDLAALGKGTAPPPEPEEEIRPVGKVLFWAGMASAVFAAAVLVLLLRLRRRN